MFPTPTLRTRHVVSVLALGLAPLTASAQQQASFSAPESLSVETPTGAMPGGAASKGKIVRLFKTAMNARDGRLVVVYGDAASTETVWDAKSHEHEARDIFSRFSDDVVRPGQHLEHRGPLVRAVGLGRRRNPGDLLGRLREAEHLQLR